MTTPAIPSDPALQAPALIDTGIRALVNNAQRLGISWTLTMGTIATKVSSNIVTVQCDGDAVTVGAMSMIGPVVEGQRVFVLLVPPGGVYILGTVNLVRIGCKFTRAANQTLSDAVLTPIQWDTVSLNTAGITQSAGVINFPIAGLWAISMSMTAAAAATGRSYIEIDPASWAGTSLRQSISTGETVGSVSTVVPLVAGDDVTTQVFFDSAAGTTMTAALTAFLIK